MDEYFHEYPSPESVRDRCQSLPSAHILDVTETNI